MGVDGGQARALTSPSLGYFLASIPTPGEERIATFMSNGKASGLAILRRQADGLYLPEKLHGTSPPADDFPLQWSPDGRRLLLNGIKGNAIYALETGSLEPVSDPTGFSGAWISDDLVIYGETSNASTGGSAILLYDLKTKTRKLLHAFPPEVSIGELDLSPDGRSVDVITDFSRSDIWMMEKTPGK